MYNKVLLAASDVAKCPKPCTTEDFEASIDTIERTGEPAEESTVVISFESNRSEVQTETLLFGVTSIVASVGGSLGLFLGFSCLDSAVRLMEQCLERGYR